MKTIEMPKMDLKTGMCAHSETSVWIIKMYCVLLLWQYIAN